MGDPENDLRSLAVAAIESNMPSVSDAATAGADEIERCCEGCGGSGVKKTTIDHNMYGKPVCANLTCPVCDGHGWVIGGKDD